MVRFNHHLLSSSLLPAKGLSKENKAQNRGEDLVLSPLKSGVVGEQEKKVGKYILKIKYWSHLLSFDHVSSLTLEISVMWNQTEPQDC